MLSDDTDLPDWAAGIPDYGVFQRGNIFMMESALLRPNADVTLLALGTARRVTARVAPADMVKLAEGEGAKACVKNSDELFGLSKGAGGAG